MLRGNGNIQDKLGQCAKVGSHNGPKCLTSCDGTLRGKRNQRSEGATDANFDLQPTLDSSGPGVGSGHSIISSPGAAEGLNSARM